MLISHTNSSSGKKNRRGFNNTPHSSTLVNYKKLGKEQNCELLLSFNFAEISNANGK